MSSVVKESVLIPSGPLCARLRFGAFGWVCAWVLALAPSAPSAETWVWVDEEGRTHFTDDRDFDAFNQGLALGEMLERWPFLTKYTFWTHMPMTG